MIRVLDSAGSTLVEWGRQQQHNYNDDDDNNHDDDDGDDNNNAERKMQPARGRFARSDLDRLMASTFPCPLESGPSSRFLGQPATGTRRVAGTTHTESGRR